MALVFANAAESPITYSISEGDENIDVDDGSLFPAMKPGEWFPAAIEGAAGLEYVRVTGRIANTLTVERAQEGTDALAFTAGEAILSLRLTKAAVDLIPFSGNASLTILDGGNYGEDIGIANALRVTIPGIGAIEEPLSVRVKVSRQNTSSAVTCDVNELGPVDVKKYDGEDLLAGDIDAETVALLTYSATHSAFILANPRNPAEEYTLPQATTATRGGVTLAAGDTALDENGDTSKVMSVRTLSRAVKAELDAQENAKLPFIWRHRGDGSDGDRIVSNGTSLIGAGQHNHFNTVAIGPDATLDCGGNGRGTVVLRCRGQLDLAGRLLLGRSAGQWPEPVIGPTGRAHNDHGTTDLGDLRVPPRRQPHEQFQDFSGIAGVIGESVALTTVAEAIVNGTPQSRFEGGHGASYGLQIAAEAAGGLIVVAESITLDSTAVVEGLGPTPDQFFDGSGAIQQGAAGGGIIILAAPTIDIDEAALFEAGAAGDLKRASEWPGEPDAIASVGNGQLFTLDTSTGTLTRVF